MALRIALSGFIALIVAMGIGRFAFTPQVPLMIAEHQFSLTGAGLVAAINYLATCAAPTMRCAPAATSSGGSGSGYGAQWR